VAGLLGCLISGRLCLILDPANPPERQAALLKEAAPALVLHDTQVELPPHMEALALADASRNGAADWRPDYTWNPDAPLAVHFTSGSTGEPKGIVLSGRSVLQRALDSAVNWISPATPEDCLFGPSIFVFSSGVALLIGTLTLGLRIVIADLAKEGAGAVLRLLGRERVTLLSVSPPVLRTLLPLEQSAHAFRALRSVRAGAASLMRADVALWRARLPRDCEIVHTYASTEALIIAQWVLPDDADGPEPTVAAGMIRPSHEFALVDAGGQPVKRGEPGELVLRGPLIALGEWRGGGLVPGRMIPVPDRPGWRAFRTGDVALLQPNGLLRIVGRADRQVKINGVRVEPAEIEAVLRRQPEVTDAAIVATQTADRIELVGFVAAKPSDETVLIAALRQRLATALPTALRPSRLYVLDRLPTLPGGKVDYVFLSRESRRLKDK
jgi:acyl-coenzyme A synthetase/AMP-(fatty) acid ligase